MATTMDMDVRRTMTTMDVDVNGVGAMDVSGKTESSGVFS
jgi:hypothetical protein